MPAKVAANCFFGALDEMVTSWVLNEHEYRLANVADTVVDIFLNGMRSGTPAVSGRWTAFRALLPQHRDSGHRSQHPVRGKTSIWALQ